MKRTLLATLVLAFVSACGGSDIVAPPPPPPPPPMVVVHFKIDAQTCVGTGVVNFYIDGSLVGGQLITAGGVSNAYTVTPAKHTLGASTANFTWGPFPVDLAGQTLWTQLLTC